MGNILLALIAGGLIISSSGGLKNMTIKYEDRWDSLIHHHAEREELDFLLVKAMIKKESYFDALAESPSKCRGLMQLSSVACYEMGIDPFYVKNPDHNIEAGCKYLQEQYSHFPEITDTGERWKFALASYNAGRGNVNKSIGLTKAEGGNWQKWGIVSCYLIQVTGKVNAAQTCDYVDKIWNWYNAYLVGQEG